MRWTGAPLGRWQRTVVAALGAASLLLNLGAAAHQARTDDRNYGAMHAGAAVALDRGYPYDQQAIGRRERADESLPRDSLVAPYVYPPTFTVVQAPFGALPFRTALRGWTVLMVLAVLGSAMLAAALALGWPLRDRVGLLVIAAFGMDFAPLRSALPGQVDPLLCLAGLAGLLMTLRGRERLGGAILSLLLLKPQVGALPILALVMAGRPQVVFGIGIGLGAQIAAVAIADISGLHLGTLAWIHIGAVHYDRSLVVVTTSLAGLLATAVIIGWGRTISMKTVRSDPMRLMAIAAVLTAVAGPLIYLNLQSAVLLILPLALVAVRTWKEVRQGISRPIHLMMLGCAGGALLGDSLFAVTYYVGYSHALGPIATVATLLIAIAVYIPELRPACLAAGLVNVAVTLPKLPVDFHNLVLVGAAVILLAMLLEPEHIAQCEVTRPSGSLRATT